MRTAAIFGVLLASMLAFAAAPTAAVTVTDYPVESGAAAGAHKPNFIVSGPGGNLWFTDRGTQPSIGRISPLGERLQPVPLASAPNDLYAGVDGVVTWTEATGAGRRLATGAVQQWGFATESWSVAANADGVIWFTSRDVVPALITPNGPFTGASVSRRFAPGVKRNTRLTDVTLGPDGNLWVPLYEEDRVVRFPPSSGDANLSVDLPAGSGPYRIAAGPDGNIWVTDYLGDAIERITPDGDRTRFPVGAGKGPNDIVAGPDGALWFTEYGGNAIGRMTTDGKVTAEIPSPTPASGPTGLTVGSDGAIWFTEFDAGRIGRLLPDPLPGPVPPPPPPGPPAPGPPAADTTPPSFTKPLATSRKRFRVGGRATALVAAARPRRAPAGTTLAFALSEPGAVVITVSARRPGVRSGKRCTSITKRNRTGRRCTRSVVVGRLRRTAAAGAGRVAFSGRIGRRGLGPGGYSATALASDAAGNRSAPSSARFTIVR